MRSTKFARQLNIWIDRLSLTREDPDPQANGIMDGRMGRALIYAVAYRYSGQAVFESKAQQLLNYITDQIGNEDLLNFGCGITGIGWAIEWLAQNKFIIENTDEILADIDDEIYKSVIYGKSPSLSRNTGTLGKALYFYSRNQSENPGTPRYKTIANLECLILLIDEIKEQLFDEEKGLLRNNESTGVMPSLPPEDIENMADSLIFLSTLSGSRIYPEVTTMIVKGIISFTGKLDREEWAHLLNESSDRQLVKAYLKLCYAFYFAGCMFRRPGWQLQGKAMFDSLTVNGNKGIYDQPVIAELFGRFYCSTGSARYLSLLEKSIDIDRYLDAGRISPLDGARVFLTLMSIQKPQIPNCAGILLL